MDSRARGGLATLPAFAQTPKPSTGKGALRSDCSAKAHKFGANTPRGKGQQRGGGPLVKTFADLLSRIHFHRDAITTGLASLALLLMPAAMVLTIVSWEYSWLSRTHFPVGELADTRSLLQHPRLLNLVRRIKCQPLD